MPIKNSAANMTPTNYTNKKGFFPNGLIALLIVVVLIGAGWWFYTNKISNKQTETPAVSLMAGKSWQAVFLTNGQVYFGRVVKETSDTVILQEIYYLRVVNPPLQTTQEGTTVPTEQSQQQISLVKLGNELHGPKDEMKINRQHIMFTEDLKDDSRVIQAIASYLEDRAAAEAGE